MQPWFTCCLADVQHLCRWVRRRAAGDETDAETLAEIDAAPGVRLLQDLHTLKAINKVMLSSCTSRLSGVARLGMTSPLLLAKQPSSASVHVSTPVSGSRGNIQQLWALPCPFFCGSMCLASGSHMCMMLYKLCPCFPTIMAAASAVLQDAIAFTPREADIAVLKGDFESQCTHQT